MSINRGIVLRDDDGKIEAQPEVFCLRCTTRERREVRHQAPECQPEPVPSRPAQVVARHASVTAPGVVWLTTAEQQHRRDSALRCECGHGRDEHSDHWETACTATRQVLRGEWTWERCPCTRFVLAVVTGLGVTFASTGDHE